MAHEIRLPGNMVVKREDFLLTSVVKRPTLEKYAPAAGAFFEFCRKHKLRTETLKQKDRALKVFFVVLYDDGFSPSLGRCTFFGVRLLVLKTTRKDVLPQAMCSLKGWQARCSGRMRLPIPEALAYLVALNLLERNKRDSATAIVLQLEAYLRPSEAVNLAMCNILPPAPLAGAAYARRWGLVIAPQATGQRTKTGHTDDSLLLADVARPWLSSVIELIYNRGAADSERLFPNLTLSGYERHVQDSVRALEIKCVQICPHVFRHSGASNDRYHQRRGLQSIQKRGRWACGASVSRYEKAAILLQAWKHDPPPLQVAAKRATRNIGGALCRAWRQGQSPCGKHGVI